MRNLKLFGLVAAALMLVAVTARGQTPVPDDQNYQYDYDQMKVDRYLDAEIWTDHSDQEYYEGDDITIYFRANRDCFVAIYSIDTRGRVNLLFPSEPGQDNFIYGGISYRLPGENDDYDLEVTGPEGFEYLQIIASREKIDIPDWYHNSGLVSDAADQNEYMDYLNLNYFVRYGGQRFAFDRASVYVNEWEEYYFRPVHWPYYPSWTVYGNCYIDYPWGSSVYINGVYWGCTPLYIPRLVVGWHTITVYDNWNHCWESDFHVSRYNTIVFNRTEINTSATVKSKYKEVQTVGYQSPTKAGYPDFEARKATVTKEIGGLSPVGKGTKVGTPSSGSVVGTPDNDFSLPKAYVRGSTKVVKTDRGYETDASNAVVTSGRKSASGTSYRKTVTSGGSSGTGNVPAFQGRTKTSGGSSTGSPSKGVTSSSGKSSDQSSGTYRKISGSNSSSSKKSGSSSGTVSKGSSGGSSQKSGSSGAPSSGSVQKKSSGSNSSGGKTSSGGKSSSGGNVKPTPPSKGGDSGGKSDNSGSKVLSGGSKGKGKR